MTPWIGKQGIYLTAIVNLRSRNQNKHTRPYPGSFSTFLKLTPPFEDDMCVMSFTVYPCLHTVLTSSLSCFPGVRPQNCTRPYLRGTVAYIPGAEGKPPICPNKQNGRACLDAVARDEYLWFPESFARRFAGQNVSFKDVLDMIPAWILDTDGKKIGTM